MTAANPHPERGPHKRSLGHWRRNGFEFLSIFIAVISAFALNNWNDNRKNALSENKILTEIYNGLEKDLEDIEVNRNGHNAGIAACNYFRKVFTDQPVNTDSLGSNYHYLTRDFISIQNVAGYETLKSKGLELIDNDSLRLQIISLYEYDYNTLRKLEEEYYEMQFQANYYQELNRMLAPAFSFNEKGGITGFELPLAIAENERKQALLYLWKIHSNRLFILEYYALVEQSIKKVRKLIAEEIDA